MTQGLPTRSVISEKDSARDVIHALVKTIKAHKMYVPEHAIRRRFLGELHGRFLRHFEAFGELTLVVKPYEFWCGDSSVYEEPNRFDNLAFRCFGDGLRKLTFHPGLTDAEVERFIAVIGVGTDARPLDEDIVTRLWDGEFVHVTYVVADPSETGGDRTEVSLHTPPVPDDSKGAPGPSDERSEAVPSLSNTAAIEIVDGVPPSDEHLYTLSEEELRRLQSDVLEDSRQNYVDQLIDILVSILTLEDDPESFAEVLAILEDIVVACLRKTAYRQAADVVSRLERLMEPESGISNGGRASIRHVVVKLGTWEHISPILEILNQQGMWDARDLSEYLRVLGPSAIPAMITLLELVQAPKGRRVICDMLIAIGRAEIDTFIHRLPSSPWYLARNLIYILGCWGEEKALPVLETLINHSDVRIRKEALKAMESIGGPRVVQAMLHFLRDPDESVRLLAMKGIRTFPSPWAVESLTTLVNDQAFSNRSEAEQQEVFETLAGISALGSQAVLSVFRQCLARRRGWPWRPREGSDLRASYALAALRRMATPAAIELVRETAQSGSGTIREEARRFLREMERTAIKVRVS